MFRIDAPFPGYQATLVLPSPQFGNTRGLTAAVQTVRSMNGTLYTYVKRKRDRKLHKWDFVVAKEKALEAKAFVELYISSLVRTVDHEDISRLGHLAINPLEEVSDGRAHGWPGDEAYRFTLQLEEKV